MRHKVRSRIAFCIAALLAAGIAFFLAAGMWFHGRAANVSPAPMQTEEGRAESASALDSDGFPEVDWDYWHSVNPDVVGWVTVPGTNIDQPIVQASPEDPDFYLKHDVYGDYNVYGCPYLDADCSAGGMYGNRNSVILGHHMTDGSMFAAFAEYSDENFARAHARILLQTPERKSVLECRFVEIVDGAELAKRVDFMDGTDYSAWYSECLSDACVVLDSASKPDSVVTFVTCSYHYSSNERTLVVASEVNPDEHA